LAIKSHELVELLEIGGVAVGFSRPKKRGKIKEKKAISPAGGM